MLNVHRFGSENAPPLLALHGVTGHGRRYVQLAQEGLPDRRVLAPDLRGHGESTWLPPWTTKQHVADLLQVLDVEGLDSVPVVGHSMGGLIGLHLALAAPGRVSRLVLLDPMVGIRPEESYGMAEGIRRDDGWATEEDARAARRAGHPESAFPSIDLDLADVLRRDGDGRWRQRFSRSAAVCGWSEMAQAPPDLSGLEVPTLCVIADEDPFDKALLLAALDRAPGPVTVERVACGHMLYWDAFEFTAGRVRKFTA